MLWAIQRKVVLFLLLVLVVCCVPVYAAAAPENETRPVVSATAAVLMDADTGVVLYEKRAMVRAEPASLTKIMTALIVLEHGHLDDVVTVSKRAAAVSMGQDIGLNPGDKITLGNLLKAALLYSANDSTVAMAEHVAGSVEQFVQLMNMRALVLGAKNTHFANTNGYHHPDHYTTAYDLALITRYALRNETFARLVSTPADAVEWQDGRQMDVRNTNRLVRFNSYAGICGVKTGSTPRAGDCLVAAARRGDKTLIAVVLNSKNRYQDAVRLLDYGFSNMILHTLCLAGESIAHQQVKNGVANQVVLVAAETRQVHLIAGQGQQVKREIVLFSPPEAPVRAGQVLGRVVYHMQGRELARVDLLAAAGVPAPGLFFRLKNLF
ncbi:D-alanyl-D-alanine carboxypeptidase family protein [Desulfurispora thermophila]|uniref:D-alanyl-D-alanine carboxypeptidase family protein n=1 Tax=Desulfurispora thermophila TaxID=265470 RepID=UPI0003617F69|nr:D-alanyl-D-alanine carboxypeptidase family protein [Desulfurispora thermophila]